MKKTISIVWVLAFALPTEIANADFTFGEPTNVWLPVNISKQDFDLTVSNDGLTFLFGSERLGGFGGSDLWMATRATTKDPWGAPVNLGPTVNSAYGETDPSLSSDGLSLFFMSDRPDGFGDADLWMTRRATPYDSWSEPENLGPTINSVYNETDPSLSVDGLTLYFSEFSFTPNPRPGGYGGCDIWLTTRPTENALWGEPINMGPIVNSEFNDYMQSVTSDGLVMFFSSDRMGGLGGVDLYMTRRVTTSDPWRDPVNLGPAVNSEFWDIDPEVSADGSILYFGRFGPSYECDLWQASIEPIVDLNNDGIVDSTDMVVMIDHWDTDNSICDIGPMPWGDGIVDVQDLIVLAEHLFEEVPPVQ